MSWTGIDEMLQLMVSLSGDRVGDDLFDFRRRSDESLSMFVLRRQRHFSQAESLGMPFPEQIKGVLLEEGAGLTQQGEQNLRVLAGGRIDAGHVSVALRSMDTTRQMLTETRAQRTLYQSDNETPPENDEESR